MQKKVNHPSPLDDAGLRETLAGRGQRFTRQRAAVYRCLTRQAAHPTAEALYREALEEVPNISLATVYKALESLVEAGVIMKIDFADSAARYDWRRDNHLHARCLRCGDILDVPGDLPAEPPALPRAPKGFRVLGYRAELLGVCAKCARREERPGRRPGRSRHE